MSTERATGNQSTGTTDDDPCERIEALEDAVDSLLRTVEQQQTEIEDLQNENEDLQQRLDNVETRQNGFGKAINSNQNKIDDIESGASDTTDATPRVQGNNNPVQADELSPLGEIVSLPEWMVDEQLSSNQQRARFVAKDIKQYGDMRLGELVISSGDIRKVLSAREETSIHWETVSRVIDFLDSMGKGDTTVKDRHGTIVCFDPSAVSKWSRSGHTVVSGDKGEV